MPTLHIVQYRAAWDINHHYGQIQLLGQNGSWSSVKQVNNPEEFRAILDLLRNEEPILYETSSEKIFTGPEPIGEDE